MKAYSDNEKYGDGSIKGKRYHYEILAENKNFALIFSTYWNGGSYGIRGKKRIIDTGYTLKNIRNDKRMAELVDAWEGEKYDDHLTGRDTFGI